jgi:hypothetical protein
LFILFAATQPLQTLYDGGFPNYLAAAIWLPFFILCLAEAIEERSWKWSLGAIVLGLLTLLTHHFSSVYLGIVLAMAALAVKRLRIWLLGSLALMVLVLISPLGASFRHLASIAVRFGGPFPWIHSVGGLDNPNALLPLAAYPSLLTPAVFWFGTAALVYVLVRSIRGRKLPLPVVLFAGWALVLYVASQIPALRFPVRLARDLGVPLTVLAAYAINGLVNQLGKVEGLGTYLKLLATIFVIAFCTPAIIARYSRLHTYEETEQYSRALADATKLTKGQPTLSESFLLPVAVYPSSIQWGEFTTNKDDTSENRFSNSDNLGLVAGKTFVIIPIFTEYSTNLAYQTFLLSADFHQVTIFHDQLRVVALYERNK